VLRLLFRENQYYFTPPRRDGKVFLLFFIKLRKCKIAQRNSSDEAGNSPCFKIEVKRLFFFFSRDARQQKAIFFALSGLSSLRCGKIVCQPVTTSSPLFHQPQNELFVVRPTNFGIRLVPSRPLPLSPPANR